MFIKMIAVVLIALSLINAVAYPAFIGKPGRDLSYAGWIGATLQAVMIIILGGHALGWW